MKQLKSAFLIFSAIASLTHALAYAQPLATRDGIDVSMKDIDAHHFFIAEKKRADIKSQPREVLKTLDEALNVKYFSRRLHEKFVYSPDEKLYVDYQTERSHLTAALAVLERRAREAFKPNDTLTIARARELWLQDEQKYFDEAQADVTMIQFDTAKRTWVDTIARIADARKALAAGENFDEVRKLYSDDARATSDGRIKGVQADIADPSLARAIFKQLRVGEVSDPIPARRGIYIVRLDAKKERTKKPFETVRPQITATLLEDDARAARASLITQLESVPITVHEAELDKLFPSPVKNPMEIIRDLHLKKGIGVSDFDKPTGETK
jgi:parvulin-like peptidyl-prolyl isomerase